MAVDIEHLRRLNPKGSGQERPLLDRLLDIGATDARLLIDLERRLENYGLPFLACCGQLAQPLGLEGDEYRVPGATKGSLVLLTARTIHMSVSSLGQAGVSVSSQPEAVASVPATQLVGFLPLRDRKALYYKKYYECMTSTGPAGGYIDPGLSVRHSDTKRTAEMWESEITAHARGHFVRAVANLLLSYRLLARRSIAVPQDVFGLFFMLSPGRVVTNGPSTPLLSAFVRRPRAVPVQASVKKEPLQRAIGLRLPTLDDFIPRLLSYERLFQAGEPDLGWIGAVSALEEYLSRYVVWPRKDRRPSIDASVNRAPLSALPDDVRNSLREVAKVRNDLVHQRFASPLQPCELDFASMMNCALRTFKEIATLGLKPVPK